MAETRTATTVNLNDYAFVRLTLAGVEQFHAHYEHLRQYGIDPQRSLDSARQDNGEHRFQLHELMLIFGPACYMGSNKMPFEKNAVRLVPST